jgi:hypothetical protein
MHRPVPAQPGAGPVQRVALRLRTLRGREGSARRGNAAARAVLDELYAGELVAIRDRFELRFSDDRASGDVAAVARAATYGAVETLIVDIDEKLPGRVDEDSGAVTYAEDDASSYGVVDEIARRVLLSSGRVVAARRSDVPGGGPVAAILRYAP